MKGFEHFLRRNKRGCGIRMLWVENFLKVNKWGWGWGGGGIYKRPDSNYIILFMYNNLDCEKRTLKRRGQQKKKGKVL